ncbi:MAG: DUF1257 domain-containing protein [Phycisphaerae bacterium]|nr:DUF1257 domain-containing protein [Phycisphaerae bacterium]
MSHYVECKPGFKDQQALIDALVAVGFDRSQIETHEEALALYGYQGDTRPQRAHIIIRRQHVGQAANDVGWERLSDGTYRAWISEYDSRHRFNPETQNRIKQEYAYHAVARQQRTLGRTVQRRELENGEIEVVIGGYR